MATAQVVLSALKTLIDEGKICKDDVMRLFDDYDPDDYKSRTEKTCSYISKSDGGGCNEPCS